MFWWFGTGRVVNYCSYVNPYDHTVDKSQAPVQESEGEGYNLAQFIDDYRLLASLRPTSGLPPSLVLFDTEDVGGPPIQTTFLFSPQFVYPGGPYLHLERGVHELSIEESQAPFYPDPAQRIVMLDMQDDIRYLVVSVGALLEFKSRGASEIGWDEWKSRVVVPRLISGYWIQDAWVSGCRLFCTFFAESSPDKQMQVFDFSARGHARYLCEEVDQSLSGLRYISPTLAQARIPWNLAELHNVQDGIVLTCVSLVVLFFSRIWLNRALYFAV